MKLILSVKTTIKDDAKREKLLLKNQNNKCLCCGIKLTKNKYILSESGKDALVCQMCMHIRNMEKLPNLHEGKIIMMPEISQADLLNLMRAIYYFKQMGDKIEDDIDSIELIEEELNERTEVANHYYSPGISNPLIMIQLLLSLSEDEYTKREVALFGLRWVPSMEYYKDEHTELKGEFAKFNPKNWNKLIKTIIEKTK